MGTLKATSVVLGLALAAGMAANFGCAGGGSNSENSAAAVTSSSSGCGCGSKETLTPDEQAIVDKVRASGIRVMTAGELKGELVSENPPIVVDVLSAENYSAAHIKGSISLPAGRIQGAAAQQLPDMGAKIVVYCASFQCGASTAAAGTLQKLGYTNVYDYKGGMKQWRELGGPIEGSEAGK